MTDSTSDLIRALQTATDWKERERAACELGHSLDQEQAFDALIASLADPDDDVRRAAILSLGKLKRPEAVSHLLEHKVHESPNPDVRWAVVQSLDMIGGKEVLQPLSRLAQDETWAVRSEASAALSDQLASVSESPDESMIPGLVLSLAAADDTASETIVNALEKLGQPAREALLEETRAASASLRAGAARALGKLGDPAGIPFLTPLLRDDSAEVRELAARALGEMGSATPAPELIAVLDDFSERVSLAASEALARIGPPGLPALLEGLQRTRGRKTSRQRILKALAKIPDPQSIPHITPYLADSYFVVRRAACMALAAIGPEALPALRDQVVEDRLDVAVLLKAAKESENRLTRIRAIRALGELKQYEAVPILRSIVDEESRSADLRDVATRALASCACAAWGRSAAICVLRQLRSEEALPVLLKATGDCSPRVRFDALRALANIPSEQAFPTLVNVLKSDPVPQVRAEAMRALRLCCNDREVIISASIPALRDSDRLVRSRAARTLGNFPDSRSVDPLVAALEDPSWRVRENAENSLSNLGAVSVDGLVGVLRSSPEERARKRAARALGRIGHPDAREPLLEILKAGKDAPRVLAAAADAVERLSQDS